MLCAIATPATQAKVATVTISILLFIVFYFLGSRRLYAETLLCRRRATAMNGGNYAELQGLLQNVNFRNPVSGRQRPMKILPCRAAAPIPARKSAWLRDRRLFAGRDWKFQHEHAALG